jgi:HlyD family type I secretion membrane fusion protein
MLSRVRDWLVPRIDSDVGAELSRVVWSGLTVIVVGVIGLGGWAAFAPLSGAVIAPGFVKVDMNRKVVQHQEGGIVKQILVRDGDRVRAGQTVMVLEDVRVDASLEALRTQLDAERAKAARLEGERIVAAAPTFPAELTARSKEARVAELIERETALFRARRQSLDTQVEVINKQIRETRDEIKAWREQISAEERAIKLMREELAANESLLKQGFVANTRILGLQRQVAEYEARYGEHQAELAKAHQRISELELRKLSMRNDYVKAATDELKDSTSRIFDLDERLRPTKDASERQKIVAPIAGEVVNLKFFTPGGVVGPREVLMDIVPDEKTLIVEARLRPEDINHVRPGAHADVRLTAYKPRNTPLVEGTVTYVSGDRLVDNSAPGGTPYYMVYIDVPHKALADAGNLKMTAGMPAEVYIRTDQRTAADYLLAPVTAYFRRGMREPL